MERGPRYDAYAELRETKLRMNYLRQQQQQQCQYEYEYEEEEEPKVLVPTPPRKQVKFQAFDSGRRKKGGGSFSSSLVAQSVPDFSAALRKENRKPMVNMLLPTVTELTPPPSSKRGCGVLSTSRGSKSANAGEKRRNGNSNGGGGGVLMASRKSYANIDELKSFSSSTTGNAINGGRNSRLVRKTVLGYREL